MSKAYLNKIFYASLIATGGNKKRAKDLVVARALADETLLRALATCQIGELVDLNFSEYQQAQARPANTPRLNDVDLDKVIAHIETNTADATPPASHEKPSWKTASENLVVMKTGQKPLNKKQLDHILDHYFN